MSVRSCSNAHQYTVFLLQKYSRCVKKIKEYVDYPQFATMFASNPD